MHVQKIIIRLLLPAVLVISACKESYEPPVIKTNLNLLVVDGFLNNSTDTTIIRLSRTRKLSDGIANAAEFNAQMMVEDESGTIQYYFQETGDGNYIVPGMNLDPAQNYKLRINTSDGKQYLSADIQSKTTPGIDSVGWKQNGDGVTIYANTHDPQNNTRYYRWEYTETWQYESRYFSFLKYENDLMLGRKQEEYIYDCWNSRNSSELLLGSSAKLSNDNINMASIRFIPVNSVEISVKYSIMVRQFAMPKEGYEYLESLKKITEQLGSIFDAQPSQITGNIHEVNDPTEPVLGFITASSYTQKRIFISHLDVKPWNYQLDCGERSIISANPDSLKEFFGSGQYLPLSEYYVMGFLVGYYATSPFCADCRMRGGVTTKPDFWQ